ncbi:MAG: FHIPEP family type III secretion protein [Acidobacteria bacterium]|nr:FHIPEP family type III secretion protein [Acidobacteriota bacterium]
MQVRVLGAHNLETKETHHTCFLIDGVLAIDAGTVSEPINGISTKEPAFGLPALWIDEKQRHDAEHRNYTVVEPSSVIATYLTELIKRHADELLTRQEVNRLLDHLKESAGKLVEEVVPEVLKPGEIQRVLQPGGTLVLGLPTERNIFRDVLRLDYYDGNHLYAFSVRNSYKILNETGFSVESLFFHLPRCHGRLGYAIQKGWNYARWPFREYPSMAYWIIATKS